MEFLGIPFGWLMYIIDSVVNNYGWSLVIFAVLTKLLVFPLAIKQQKSTAKTMLFQPKLKALQKQYGNNKAKYQEEMMKLYEQEGISPTAGCLPMIVQMVLLFGMIEVIYRPLRYILRVPLEGLALAEQFVLGKTTTIAPQMEIISRIQAGSTEFEQFFSQDVIQKINQFDIHFMGINLGDMPTFAFNLVLLIPIFYVITSIVQTIVTTKIQEKNGQEMQGGMKYMMYAIPAISLWFAFSYPAGLGFYWTISNIIMILQTLLLQKMYPPSKIAQMTEKETEKARAKMKARREKMQSYTNKTGTNTTQNYIQDSVSEDGLKDKEISKKRIAEARRRMAEKYGDTDIDN